MCCTARILLKISIEKYNRRIEIPFWTLPCYSISQTEKCGWRSIINNNNEVEKVDTYLSLNLFFKFLTGSSLFAHISCVLFKNVQL